jgi:heptosyltransferase-3
LYVGPDTVVTHMAAGLGVPTVALFGPSNPVKWGPWPRGADPRINPWQRTGSQVNGNVRLLQGQAHCVPCMQEGCERRLESFSDCLQHLDPQRVIRETEALLDGQQSVGDKMAGR